MIVIDDGYTDDSDNYRSQASTRHGMLVDEVVFGGESAMKKYRRKSIYPRETVPELIGGIRKSRICLPVISGNSSWNMTK